MGAALDRFSELPQHQTTPDSFIGMQQSKRGDQQGVRLRVFSQKMGIPFTEKVTVDASAGGTSQTTNLTTVPVSSVILNVTAIIDVPFNGSGTTTLQVGVGGNIDNYIDTVDFDPSGSAGTMAISFDGTTNDQKTFEAITTATLLIASWTNSGTVSAGKVSVYVTYINLA